jgi:hypothetical protein
MSCSAYRSTKRACRSAPSRKFKKLGPSSRNSVRPGISRTRICGLGTADRSREDLGSNASVFETALRHSLLHGSCLRWTRRQSRNSCLARQSISGTRIRDFHAQTGSRVRKPSKGSALPRFAPPRPYPQLSARAIRICARGIPSSASLTELHQKKPLLIQKRKLDIGDRIVRAFLQVWRRKPRPS